VIRLRLVQDYRGRRIVTNGELYGIEDALVMDCRYLDVAGARAAIDSGADIEARRVDLEKHREQLAQYIDHEGRDATFGCDCGWRGTNDELKRTGKPDLFRCPTCASNSIMMFGDAPDEPVRPKKERVARKKTAEKNKKKTAAGSRTPASQLPALDGAERQLHLPMDDSYIAPS
jgi:hypothetical protein